MVSSGAFHTDVGFPGNSIKWKVAPEIEKAAGDQLIPPVCGPCVTLSYHCGLFPPRVCENFKVSYAGFCHSFFSSSSLILMLRSTD